MTIREKLWAHSNKWRTQNEEYIKQRYGEGALRMQNPGASNVPVNKKNTPKIHGAKKTLVGTSIMNFIHNPKKMTRATLALVALGAIAGTIFVANELNEDDFEYYSQMPLPDKKPESGAADSTSAKQDSIATPVDVNSETKVQEKTDSVKVAQPEPQQAKVETKPEPIKQEPKKEVQTKNISETLDGTVYTVKSGNTVYNIVEQYLKEQYPEMASNRNALRQNVRRGIRLVMNCQDNNLRWKNENDKKVIIIKVGQKLDLGCLNNVDWEADEIKNMDLAEDFLPVNYSNPAMETDEFQDLAWVA